MISPVHCTGIKNTVPFSLLRSEIATKKEDIALYNDVERDDGEVQRTYYIGNNFVSTNTTSSRIMKEKRCQGITAVICDRSL